MIDAGAVFQFLTSNFTAQKPPFIGKNSNLIADKFNDRDLESEIESFLNCKDGEAAYQIHKSLKGRFKQNRAVSSFLKNEWGGQGLRDEAMWQILNVKFAPETNRRALLEATGKAYLLEHNQRAGIDNYWSDNQNGSGYNMLGKMLMAIRDTQPQPKVPTSQDLQQGDKVVLQWTNRGQ